MPSKLRPMLSAAPGTFAPQNGTAYYMILSAVKVQHGLVHGKLHEDGEHCAIGSYFAINANTALNCLLIDEVAAVNDSVPHLSPRQRKFHVMRWLKWKLHQLGMDGFKRAAAV